MSHYAKIEDGIVVSVNVVEDDYFNANRETRYTGKWVKTSYNTHGGVHYDPITNEPDNGTPVRKNYAALGMVYDEELDAFYSPQPYPSWTLDLETCWWTPPVPKPKNCTQCIWNEENQVWL
jgi:hypothetical protein